MRKNIAFEDTLTNEAACLASLIIDNKHMPFVFEILKEEDFYHEETKLIFSVLQTLWTTEDLTNDKSIDGIMVMDLIKRRCLWSDPVREILTGALESLPSAANCEYYSNKVKEYSEERKVANALNEANKMVANQALSLEEKKAAIASVFAKLTQSNTDSGIIAVHDKAFGLLKQIKSQTMGITTGYRSLDKPLWGLSQGEIIILAGRPSMGKSSLMLDMALSAAKAGKKVLIFSLEMSYESVIDRIMVNLSKVWLDTIRGGWETDDEMVQLSNAENEIAKMKLWIKASPTLRPIDVYSTAKLMMSQYGLDIVYIDYMQLMQPNTRKENRQQEVSSISMDLKATAMLLSLPIIVLSQLNRATEGRQCTRPKLSDLRESGSIEQDAHKIILLHREDYYKMREDPTYKSDGGASCIIAKNRQGPCGEVQLTWVPEEFSFKEIVSEEDQMYQDREKAKEEEETTRPNEPTDAQEESLERLLGIHTY